MTCSACGKEGLTARTAVASGMVPDIERLYCKCAAPASCSEVVERLQECFHHPIGKFDRAWFDWTMAEKILTEWRERRVQELEERNKELEAKIWEP